MLFAWSRAANARKMDSLDACCSIRDSPTGCAMECGFSSPAILQPEFPTTRWFEASLQPGEGCHGSRADRPGMIRAARQEGRLLRRKTGKPGKREGSR